MAKQTNSVSTAKPTSRFKYRKAFFGGRTSAHIRKVPVPVVYVDFLSMYPTVNGLMDLRQFLIAREIQVKHCCSEIEEFLRQLTPENCLDKKPGNGYRLL